MLLVPGLADKFVEPTEQRVAAATVISPAMVGEVTIDRGNDVRESNSIRLPVGRDTPELERRRQAIPAVEVADPATVSVEISVINRDHHFPRRNPPRRLSLRRSPELISLRSARKRILPIDRIGRFRADARGQSTPPTSRNLGGLSPDRCRGRSMASTQALRSRR